MDSLVWVSGLDGGRVGAVRDGLVELWHDERLDQSETLGLAVEADHPKADLLIDDAELTYRDRVFRIAEVTDNRDGNAVYRHITADALWYELGDNTVAGSFALDATVAAGLTTILAGSRWTVGSRTIAGGADFAIEQTDQTRLAILRTWAKVTGADVVFDTQKRTVDLVTNRGRELGLAYRYRRNVLTHIRRRRPPEATVLLPFGADDLVISGVNGGNPQISDFTYYTDRGIDLATAEERFTRRQIWVDSSFLREADLYAGAVRRLARLSAERVSYELGVVDLSDVSGVAEEVRVADIVRVSDPAFGTDVRVIVVRFLHDYLDPTRNVVELATIEDPLPASSSSSRTAAGISWEQFVGPVLGTYAIRSDGDYITNRIGLRFREGSRANFHVDLWAVGVGAGDMIVTVIDTDADPEQQHFKTITVPYTNGATVRAFMSWAEEDLTGAYNYKVRVTTEASGGPSGSNGVDIAPDTVDPAEASFWIMAQGAVQETPLETTSITFNYTGAVQAWTVPDDVEEVTIVATGGSGASGGASSGGLGGEVGATFPVTPGTALDVFVGGAGSSPTAGWPNGGTGGTANNNGKGGGGSSSVAPASSSFDNGFAASLIVAGGGGGGADSTYNTGAGGTGAYLAGGNPATGACTGGTQSAGGNGTNEHGDTDGQGYGGDGANSGAAAVAEGGGGGGGWHGGGGSKNDVGAGGGGGGSGYTHPTANDIEIADGSSGGDGVIVISWGTPV